MIHPLLKKKDDENGIDNYCNICENRYQSWCLAYEQDIKKAKKQCHVFQIAKRGKK